MAIYYCKVTNISRGTGRSAVGSAAYRANEKIKNYFDGKMHNYTHKHDVVHKEILTPNEAPHWANNRKKLWNEVEKIEKNSNSRLSREITVALPNELSRQQQIELSKEYCKEAFVSQGMVADLCIHDKGEGNPHAHIMLTTRGFDEKGNWQPKSRKEYILDENGEKIKLKSGEWKSSKIDANDWNTTERLQIMREQWAEVANRYLPKELHIDHRSYEKQGIDKIGTVHMGHGATALERKGIETEKGNLNREITESNRYIELLNKESQKADREIGEIRKEIEIEKPEQSREKESVVADPQQQGKGSSENEKELFEEAKERVKLNRDYIKLELEISEKHETIGKLDDKIRIIDNASEKIGKGTSNIERWQKDIEKLKEKKQGLNIFQVKEKRSIDEQIKGLEKPIEQVSNNLEREHGIKPGQAQTKLMELEKEKRTLISQKPALTDITELRKKQEVIEFEYKFAMVKLECHPNQEHITELMEKMKMAGVMDTAPKMKILKAERQLKTLSVSELQKLLKLVPVKSKEAEVIQNKISAILQSKAQSIHKGISR